MLLFRKIYQITSNTMIQIQVYPKKTFYFNFTTILSKQVGIIVLPCPIGFLESIISKLHRKKTNRRICRNYKSIKKQQDSNPQSNIIFLSAPYVTRWYHHTAFIFLSLTLQAFQLHFSVEGHQSIVLTARSLTHPNVRIIDS